MVQKEAPVPAAEKENPSDEGCRRATRRRTRRKKRPRRKEQEEANQPVSNREYHLPAEKTPPSEDRPLQEPLPRTRNPFAKEWDPIFSQDRDHNDDSSFVEARRCIFSTDRTENPDDFVEETGQENVADENGISTFLCDFDDSMALVQVDEVKEFCEKVSLRALKSGDGPAGYGRASWVDDRHFSRQESAWCARKYDNPLTARSLYRVLREQVRSFPLTLSEIQADNALSRDFATTACLMPTDVLCKSRTLFRRCDPL
jgi:hypothetical protein